MKRRLASAVATLVGVFAVMWLPVQTSTFGGSRSGDGALTSRVHYATPGGVA